MSNMAFKAKQSLTALNDSVHTPHQGMLSCPQSASQVQHVQHIAKLFRHLQFMQYRKIRGHKPNMGICD